LLLVPPTVLGVAMILFVLLRIVPGDRIGMMIPPGAGQADIDRLRQHYGLAGPLLHQFVAWLADLARGDLGTSISLRQGVVGLVLDRLPATLELALVALTIATAPGLGAALLAA
jgi:peptide/nickel transport system permease protein